MRNPEIIKPELMEREDIATSVTGINDDVGGRGEILILIFCAVEPSIQI